jgi:uncharacterized protein (DUF305 family)
MKTMHTYRTTAALLAALAAAACSGTAGSGMDTTPAATPAPQTGTSTAELEAIYRARTDSSLMDFTAADVDFMTGMIAHHAQALVMADLAPENGASPAVRTLCSRILNAQRDEIGTMRGWLADRGQPVPEIRIEGVHLMIEGVAEHHKHMPGMLTQEQLDELGAARGTTFDRLFLRYMIDHHQGAVDMVHDLFATDGAALDELVFKLANDIQVDQTTEIARMERMLEAISGAGRRP